MSPLNLGRRGFVKSVAGVSLFSIIPSTVLRGATAPSNQLTRAIIGFGSIATSGNHLANRDSRLIAVCDPFKSRVKNGIAAAEKAGHGKIVGCGDFRDILAMKDVDIVHICTPSHWHGVMSVMASDAGKDIFCEKPMTRTIGEGKRVKEVIQANGTIFRLNTWFRFKDSFYGFGQPVKNLKKVVDSGVLGYPLKVTVSKATGFDLKMFWSGLLKTPPQPVPADLDYEMWLGPAPWKPYHPDRVSGNFRGYWDYDGGGLGDMGQHYLDPVQYVLGKDNTSPVRVEYVGPQQHPEVVGQFQKITFIYADGTQIVFDRTNENPQAPYIEGSKGSIWPGLKSDIPELDLLIKQMPEPAPQATNFIECVRTREKFALNEDNGFRSATLVNLGIVAMRLGRGFRFDPDSLTAVNDEAANRFIYQQIRAPWKI